MVSWLERLLLFLAVAGAPALGWLLVFGEAPPPLLWPASVLLAAVLSWLLHIMTAGPALGRAEEQQIVERWLKRQREDLIGPDWKRPTPPDDANGSPYWKRPTPLDDDASGPSNWRTHP